MLTPKQRSYLSSMAHQLQPVVMVGKNGLTEALIAKLRSEFTCRELLKVRFIDCKDQKQDVAQKLAEASGADIVRIIGNIAIMYRTADDPKNRVIQLPQ